jgi:opacity protein-like surface antigen
MRSLCASLLLLAVVSGFAPTARADDDPNTYSRKGPYLGIGATYAFQGISDAANEVEPFPIHVSDSWGVNSRFGYRFAPWFATEFEYEWVNGFRARTFGLHAFDVETHTITTNAKFILPLGPVQPYLLAGLGATHFGVQNHALQDIDVHHDWALASRLGVGIDTYLTPNVVLNVGGNSVLTTAHFRSQFDRHHRESDLNYFAVQMGVEYRF